MRPALLLLCCALAATATAQPSASPPDSAAAWPREAGWSAALLLTNYGFGVAGTLRRNVGPTTALVAEAALGAGRDEREQAFFSGPFGETVVPYKRHRVLLLPLVAGVEQRLWAEAIEDSFRPVVVAAAGPVLGFQWPYFRDENDSGIREIGEPLQNAFDLRGGELRLGVSGTLALGAHLRSGPRQSVAVRIGVAAHYFPVPIELLEPRPGIERPDRHLFATPVLSLHLVRFRREARAAQP